MKSPAAVISVSWGNDVDVSIKLTPRNWKNVQRGKPLQLRGKGYYYDGEFFRDYWSFGGGLDGTLSVCYGEDASVGFEGTLRAARIEEKFSPETKKRRKAR